MNCKRIQELIMTDYMDGEASGSVESRIKAHLSDCADCRAFEQSLCRKSEMLFKNAHPVQPPPEVWQKIKEAVREDQTQYAPSFLERLFDFLRESFAVRRPAYALATAFTVILVVGIFLQSPLRKQMIVKDYLSQSSAFMVAMNGPLNGDLDKVTDFNTAIEQYLF
jgi:predicted anti-sigma-YlaC factor YlaD